jgi:serine-type D-Ala-D-Ala carboxypeptidase/endopeptidase (penicillin-binding protein 4)
MKKSLLLIIPIILSFIFFSSCATLRPPALNTPVQIDSLLTKELFNTAQVGISVYDLTDNKLLYQHNSSLLFRPASNQKILTTAAAYLFLGENYNFSTSVHYSGEIKDSILHGNVFFKGNFDPGFTVKDLDSLVKQLKITGIKEIAGNIYEDISAMDSLYWGKGWMWDDDAQHITPLPISENTVKLIVKPGNADLPAEYEMIPAVNFFKVKNISRSVTAGSKTLSAVKELYNSKVYILKGNIPVTSSPDTLLLAVANPVQYFFALTKESLLHNGISFTGTTDTLSLPFDSKKLFTVEHNIVPIIHMTNKNSNNFYAELILRTLALKQFGKFASAQNGFAYVDSLISLSGIKNKDYRLADGSGLSHYNLVSPNLLISVLKYIYYKHPGIFNKLYDSFPVAGIDGTLKERMKKSTAMGKVHAKTGGLSGVNTLSGYIQSRNNHMIAFSILIQNYAGSAERARQIQDKLCEIIFNQN